MILFSELLRSLPDVIKQPEQDVEVTSPITEDHRRVQPGGVFVARKGEYTDAHNLIPEAINRGAVAIVGEHPLEKVNCTIPYAQVSSAQYALGPLASAYYGYPSHDLVVIGVTGTDGKTTTSTLIYNILKMAGLPVGLIGTVSAIIGDEVMPTGLHVTTPGADEIQNYLRRMVDAGLTYCVLETTSHGLAQGRTHGVDYDVAVLTNLTHEHLDFHGSFEEYRKAKALLFKALSTTSHKPGLTKTAVINASDPSAGFFLSLPAERHLTYSSGADAADYRANVAKFMPTHTELELALPHDRTLAIDTMLVGQFNVDNILAAVAVTDALNCSLAVIKQGVEAMQPVPGRMERVDEGQPYTAIVDFAHTPNALRRALEAARAMLPEGQHKRIIAVFGSAGLRDREKRRLMAETSAQLADITVLTAEDPRTESLAGILQLMAEAAIREGAVEGQTVFRVPDRGQALAFACSLAQPGDIVIACGKGHEQSMCFGNTEYPWDDREAMRAAIKGTPLHTLPTASSDAPPLAK